jgi:hypothetical protein
MLICLIFAGDKAFLALIEKPVARFAAEPTQATASPRDGDPSNGQIGMLATDRRCFAAG